MGHEDAGHYALKHPDKEKDPKAAALLAQTADKERIACPDAHRIAKQLQCTPEEIGIQADLAELRLSNCQLGLFGHLPAKKNLNMEFKLSKEIHEALDEASGPEKRLSCLQCWDLARRLGISRVDMGSACELKEIRIKPCQLGAF